MPPIAAFAIQLMAGSMLTMGYTGMTERSADEVSYLLSALAVMCSGVVFALWYRSETGEEIRGDRRQVFNVKNIVKFSFLALGCQLFVSGLLSLLTDYFPKALEQYGATIGSILSGSPIMVIVVTVIVAPITEELIFRGVTLHIANRHIPFYLANLLQAILFGIYHGNLVQGVYAGGLGFILGLIYQKFRTIYAPILLHMLVNASAFFVMLIPETKISYRIIVSVGLLVMILAYHRIKSENLCQEARPKYRKIDNENIKNV